MRQVDSFWKSAVDRALSLDPERFLTSSNYLGRPNGAENLLAHALTLPPGGNPFLGNYTGIDINLTLSNQLRRLLDAFGHRLKTVTVSSSHSHLIDLIQLLELVGNVEKLSLLDIPFEQEPLIPDLVLPPLPHLTSL